MPVRNSIGITDVAIQCIKKYTKEPYVLWIVDNDSNQDMLEYLSNLRDVNIIYNQSGIGTWYYPHWLIKHEGSFANAIALELAAQIVKGKYMFVMHNDALPVSADWLTHLKSKLDNNTKIAGVSQDKTRVKAVHTSGFLFDFELYEKLDLSFMHNLPAYDVGDYITTGLLGEGYKKYVCMNTFNNPATINLITYGSYPDFIKNYSFDRSFNDDGELIFMHLGRGTTRTKDEHPKEGYMKRSEWVNGIKKHFLRGQYAKSQCGNVTL
ncbi:MAG: glycosyltransferase family A protein [Candidatus Ratteibacteria bacterium]|nr:glycosyltransferase family A protein [Candidatus Ratteibacteria bacterium]